MANGTELVQRAFQGLGQSVRGAGQAFENRNERLERDEERKKKEEAERVRQERLGAVSAGIEGLAKTATETPGFSEEDLVKSPEAQAIIRESIESGDPRVLQSLGPIQDIIKKRREEDLEKTKLGKTAEVEAKRDKEAKAKSAKDQRDETRTIRKEYEGDKTTNRTNIVRDAFGKIQKSSESGTGPGDLSMVFAYMKLLDPESAVRESEFKSAEGARSYFTGLPTDADGNKVTESGIVIPSSVAGFFQKLDPKKGGAFLLPEQRQQFVNEAAQLYRSNLEIQKSKDAQFIQDAEDAGIDPKRVISRRADDDLRGLDEYLKSKAPKEEKKKTDVKILHPDSEEAKTLMSKNQAAFEAKVQQINADRAAKGLPPLSDEEKTQAINRLLRKNNIQIGSGAAVPPGGAQ
jgi:hypothetical protein